MSDKPTNEKWGYYDECGRFVGYFSSEQSAQHAMKCHRVNLFAYQQSILEYRLRRQQVIQQKSAQ